MPELSSQDVLVDLCVQREYLADGPHRCANADALQRGVRQMMVMARWSGCPVMSCIDVHRTHDIGEDYVGMGFEDVPPLEKMPGYTLLGRHLVVENDNCLCMPLDILERVQQAIFVKVHKDPFTNPKLERLFTEMPARRFVVFGAPLESSLRLLVLGLLRRNRKVVIVEDSCGFFHEQEATMVLRQLNVKGAELLTSEAYVQDAVARLSQRPRSARWKGRRSVA